METRMIGPQPLIVDRAAQFFTLNDSWFGELVDGWLERGLVQRGELKWVVNSLHFLLHFQDTLVLMGYAFLPTLDWPRVATWVNLPKCSFMLLIQSPKIIAVLRFNCTRKIRGKNYVVT